MVHVVFVVPYALETTLRFARSVAAQPGVRLGVISQEPAERLPKELRERLSAHEMVTDALDSAQLSAAVRTIGRGWGGKVDRILGVLEQLQVPLAEVRAEFGLPGMTVAAAHNFRDKSRMKDVLREAGLPCAGHGLAHSVAEAVSHAERIGFPLVVKPPAGAGAKHTARVDHQDELRGFLRDLPPTRAEPVLLEEFIVGREHSFDSVSIEGEHVFHSISRYYPTPLEVMEVPWIQWCVVLPREVDGTEFDDIRSAGKRALTALGMDTGITHMEWFRRTDGSIAISEVAARPPGAQFTTLISYAHDRDFYDAWARLVCLGEFDVPERKYAAGAAFLRGKGSGRVVSLKGLDEAQKKLGDVVVEAKLPRYGQAQASSYEGEGYVIVRHPETQVVEQALEQLIATVQVELA